MYFCEILLDHLTWAFLCCQGYLIDTMPFVDALPSLRARQWQLMVLVLLLLDKWDLLFASAWKCNKLLRCGGSGSLWIGFIS
jgi:hypothetical protein